MNTDERLIKGLLKRDKVALEELYDRYYLLVWKIVSAAETDQRICEQLVTQVFAHVWRKPDEFTGGKRLALLLIECCHAALKERIKLEPACLKPIKFEKSCG